SNVSIDEIEQSDLNIYPNPTNGFITLSSNDSYLEEITLVNIQGQIVLSKDVSSKKIEIDVAEYPSGVYFMTAQLSNGQTTTKKLIKY
ncbi:MAG: T9SS type A sorting domain-containing protein, partial [Crocinitomicaceae bacterium]